jgi:DNA-binding CsgD family transcriptional regulator
MPATTVTPAQAVSPIVGACFDGRADCGHITRSSSVPVKRALFLFRCESEGLGFLGGRHEAPETLAALALMRVGADCADILAVDGPAAEAVTAILVDALEAVSPTATQVGVLVLVAEGLSYPEIAAQTGRSVETVRSLVKAAMARTLTHSAIDAAVWCAAEGLI